MRVTLNRAELSSVLNDAEKIAPASSPLDSLKGALLEAEDGKLTVTASNLEVTLKRTIPCGIQEAGSTVFSAKLLAAMLRLLEGDEVFLETTANHQLLLKAGTAVYQAAALDPANYPQTPIPFPEDTVSVTGIQSIAKRTAFAVREDNASPIMRCINLIFSSDGLRAVGSDGFRIAAAKGDSKSTGEISLLIPVTSLEKLASLVSNQDSLQVGTTGKYIVFTMENFAFSARLMDGRPIDAQAMLSAAQPRFTVLTDAAAMRSAVDSVVCVAEETARLMLRFDGQRVALQCTGENGNANGALDVVALSGTPSGEYWYNGKQLYECLRAQNGTMMVDVAQGGVLLLRTDELICMQTAIRKPSKQKAAPPQAEKKRKNAPLEKAA